MLSLLEMELRHLQALVGIAEQGSFSSAADFLGTVQSNISSHIARLERELGSTLVDRSTSKLTAEGEVVLARAYRVQAELDALNADMGALNAEVAGTVRAGMIGTTAQWLLPMLLASTSKDHPKLRLVVTEGTTTVLEPQLAAGRLDLAVLTMPVPGRDLTSEALFEEELVLVVPYDNDPTNGRAEVDLAELAGIELLLPAPGTPFRAELDTAVKPANLRLRPRAELDGVRLIASLTFEGYGPSILPSTAVPARLRSRFRLVGVTGLPFRRVGLALRSRGMPSAPAIAVLSALREAVADPEGLPAGLHPLRPQPSARAEGSLRSAGPNG